MANVFIAVSGIGVIVAILMIFLYLLYEVAPLFRPATIQSVAAPEILVQRDSAPLYVALDGQAEVLLRLTEEGIVRFYSMNSGELLVAIPLAIPTGLGIVSVVPDSEISDNFAMALTDGSMLIAEPVYSSQFSGDEEERIIVPGIEYPFGDEPIKLAGEHAIKNLAFNIRGDALLAAAIDDNNQLNIVRVSRESSLFSALVMDQSGRQMTIERVPPLAMNGDVQKMIVGGDQTWLYTLAASGEVSLRNLRMMIERGEDDIVDRRTSPVQGQLTMMTTLMGGMSLLLGYDDGRLEQWFPVQEEQGWTLRTVREFAPLSSAVVAIQAEQLRKNFLALDATGQAAIYNATARTQLLTAQLQTGPIAALALAPGGDALILESVERGHGLWTIRNDHPEISWSVLWDKIWYETYPEPDYIWQSSYSADDFEPKYSLMPLAFGTLKAAFFAMLLAVPLAICGAVYTGYFMAPAMRRRIKPLIELMEALPTVVLGFLAGLWLAPIVENHLLSILSLLVLLPLGTLLTSFAWMHLPNRLRHAFPEGWEAALLIPVFLLIGIFSMQMAAPLENWLFDGSLRNWLSLELGVSFDQRNAMIVGIAMGFAVIPTIFSIAEDAIFTVPKQLTYGSLALGATPWQSLYHVVLPTASPGIFSAVMIGLGRAVGETMIVLMATGNTPIMDFNVFEGMRTLSANIAVEIPESEVGSTHYRILFLAALVLFLFTFAVNTIAELVRQQLRSRYSAI